MNRIAGVMLTVADIHTMTDFFTRILSFEVVGRREIAGNQYTELYGMSDTKAELVILNLGISYLYLLAFQPPGKSFPEIKSNDLLFQHIAIVVSDLDRAHQQLKKAGIQGISSQPITIPEWNKPAAGVRAYYFRSPEGHPLELISFPSDKGRSLWHDKQALLLGIDHTAIVVSDTNAALRFYETLGMIELGGSLNYGDTQETLSGVTGAKVQVTGLGFKATDGMNLEFLHYLNPLDGKVAPALSGNDLGCTYTVITVDDINQHKNPGLSKGDFLLYDTEIAHCAIMATDIDGHRIIFVNKEGNHGN